MTKDDDRKAQARRANELREQIKKQASTSQTKPKSPRDAIHDKMRELDSKSVHDKPK